MSNDRDDLVPPVEPLPDLTWARLERQLWQTLDAPAPRVVEPPRARRWRWPAIAGTAIAATAAIALMWPRGDGARLGPGEVELAAPAKPSRIASAGAIAELSFGDADIRLAPHSTLFLGGDDQRGVDLLLERGRVSFEVAPRAGRAPFVVRAGAVRITVIGTAFTVARDGDSAQVAVTHGVVEVLAAGRLDHLTAGQLWDRGVIRAGTLALDDTLAMASPNLNPTPTPIPIPIPTPIPIPIPTPTRTPIPTPIPTPIRIPTPTPTPSPSPDPKAQFAAAAALEASAPARAQQAYLALADDHGPWAGPALYAAARLAHDRHDGALARQLLDRYLTRFPHGRNALDARALLERLDAPPR